MQQQAGMPQQAGRKTAGCEAAAAAAAVPKDVGGRCRAGRIGAAGGPVAVGGISWPAGCSCPRGRPPVPATVNGVDAAAGRGGAGDGAAMAKAALEDTVETVGQVEEEVPETVAEAGPRARSAAIPRRALRHGAFLGRTR